MGSNTEKKQWTNLQNWYKNWCKEIKSDNYCYRDSWKSDNFREREPSKKKQRTDTKKDAKRIKNDNFTRKNREK